MDACLAPMLLVLVLSINVTAVHSQIQKGPVNALRKVGDSVTLDCVTSSKNCNNVEWRKMEGAQSLKKLYQDGIGMLNGDAFPTQRYTVNSSGGCSLTITQLNISDSGRFICSQLIDATHEAKGCVLVVIGVAESCQSNVTSNALTRYDGYSLSTVINVPEKSVEPWNVILSFQNKSVDETETMDDSQSRTVKTTLTGIAGKANISQRVCLASFPPDTAANFDSSTATLDVCITQQTIVSCPVENIAVSPSSGPYYFGTTVHCTAVGHPYPTFKWTHLESGNVHDNETLVVAGAAGDKYNCTATNTVKGRAESQSLTIKVSRNSDKSTVGCGQECVAAIVMSISITLMVIFVVGWKLGWWPMRCRFLYSLNDLMHGPVGIIIGCLVLVPIVGLCVTVIVCRIVPSCPFYDSIKAAIDKKERQKWLREKGWRSSDWTYGPQ